MSKYKQMDKEQEICDIGRVPNKEGKTLSNCPIPEKSLTVCRDFLSKCDRVSTGGIFVSTLKWYIMDWYEKLYGLGEPRKDGHNFFGEYEISYGAMMKAAVDLGIGIRVYGYKNSNPGDDWLGDIQVNLKSVKKIVKETKKR
jgi:hypothetical protein